MVHIKKTTTSHHGSDLSLFDHQQALRNCENSRGKMVMAWTEVVAVDIEDIHALGGGWLQWRQGGSEE